MSRYGGLDPPPAYEEIEKVKVHQFFVDRRSSVSIRIQPKSDVSIRNGENCTCIFINVINIPHGAHWKNYNDYWVGSREDDGKGAVYIFSFFGSFESWVTISESSVMIEVDKRKEFR